MKILELFSGYGTASFALKRLGIDYEIIGYSDINKYANQCFQQNHGGKELGDVKLINPNNLEDFDLLTGGFPCQAFSTSGKMLGEADPRGSLFYEIIRIAEVKKPKYMLLENVKGLIAPRFKDTFNKILSELERIGYNVYWKVLNSKDYGIPRSRARVWFVCFRKDIDSGTFKFPQPTELKIFIKDILEDEVDKKYYLSPLLQQKFKDYMDKKVHSLYPRSDTSGNGGHGHLCKDDGTSYAIDTGNCQAIVERGTPLNIMDCIGTAFGKRSFSKEEKRMYYKLNNIGQLRRLTPKECFRLMGFLNDEINLDGLSDTQQYKLAGNGQDVNMVTLLFKQMFQSLLPPQNTTPQN